MKPLDPSLDIPQVTGSQKIKYSSTTKAAIAAILLAGTSAIASAADTSNNVSPESNMGSTTELLLHLGGTALLGAFVYCSTKKPRHGR